MVDRPTGWNPNEIPGGAVGEGYSQRIVSPTNGGGIFNPNLNPAVVGVDRVTGDLAPYGTDMSFAAPIRRELQAGVINGDFSAPPTDATLPIDSDPDSDGYNPIDGWTYVPGITGATAVWVDGTVLLTGTGYLEQLVRIPASEERAFICVPRAYFSDALGFDNTTLVAQFLEDDATTTAGTAGTSPGFEQVLTVLPNGDGRVPSGATYLRVRAGISQSDPTADNHLSEVSVGITMVPAPTGLYGARMRRSTSQSIANATDKSILFTSEDWDSDGFHAGSDPSPEIPAGGGGFYLIGGGVEFATDSVGEREVWIEHEGVDGSGTPIPGTRIRVPAAGGGGATRLSIGGHMWYLEDIEFLSLTVRQNSGGALNVVDATFWLVRLFVGPSDGL